MILLVVEIIFNHRDSFILVIAKKEIQNFKT